MARAVAGNARGDSTTGREILGHVESEDDRPALGHVREGRLCVFHVGDATGGTLHFNLPEAGAFRSHAVECGFELSLRLDHVQIVEERC